MLHKDITTEMTLKEIIDLAYAEYSPRLPRSADLKIKSSGDDGGYLLEFFVQGEDNAKMLREDLPPDYNNMRTIVIYSYKQEDGEDFLF